MKCVLCGNNRFTYLFSSQGRAVEQCSSCNLVRTKNFSPPSYKKYHRDDEYQSSEKIFHNIFLKRFEIISRFIKGPGSILDIGASHGLLLDIFKEKGWRTSGIEPSAAADFAKKKGHIMYTKFFEEIPTPKNKFDLIVANHVLEHTKNPFKFALKANEFLKKDGMLFIDVPNFGSLASRIAGGKWKFLLTKEHSYHFTKETLSEILKKSGFAIVHVETRSGIFDVANPIKKLVDEFLMLRKSFFYDLIGIPGNIISTFLNKGTSLSILAKKI